MIQAAPGVPFHNLPPNIYSETMYDIIYLGINNHKQNKIVKLNPAFMN